MKLTRTDDGWLIALSARNLSALEGPGCPALTGPAHPRADHDWMYSVGVEPGTGDVAVFENDDPIPRLRLFVSISPDQLRRLRAGERVVMSERNRRVSLIGEDDRGHYADRERSDG